MKYHSDFQSDDGRWVYLESSYLTGFETTNHSVTFTGDFCISLSESEWWKGHLRVGGITQCQIKIDRTLNCGTCGELDFGSPHLETSDTAIVMKLDIGDFKLTGKSLTTTLTLTARCENRDG